MFGPPEPDARRPRPPAPRADEPERLLVVANRTCPCPALIDLVAARATLDTEVLVVSPALNRRLRHWVSDTDGAMAAARERLELALGLLGDAGVSAGGEIGDADPLQAIEDALARFPADALIVSTHPPGESNWLEKDLVQRAEERFELPVTHLVSSYGLLAGGRTA